MKQSNDYTLSPTSIRHMDIYRVALELITFCRTLIPRMCRFNRKMGEQIQEALASIVQNLSEGMRRIGKDRGYLFTVALGSADEVRAILDACAAWGIITAEEHMHADNLADRICAMGYRLRQKMA